MINPAPVDPKNSPYGSLPTSSIPPTISRPAMSRPASTLAVPSRKKNRRRLFFLCFLSLVVAGGTYIIAQFTAFKNNVLVQHQGESSSLLSYDPQNNQQQLNPAQFKHAGDGRFNVVVVGVGGIGHDGAWLTDSIQLVSLDTFNKKLHITSIPRDLYVNIPGYGYSKINAVYEVGEQRQKGGGAVLLRQVIQQIVGPTFTNFGLIDFSGARELVDTMGGVDINVPKAIDDEAYPCDDDVHFCPFAISAGPHHLDGATALKYMRTRHDDSDFARSGRQQQIASALKEKALSLGTLTNPDKIARIIQVLGDHVKTDLTQDELQAFVKIYRTIQPNDTTSSVLDTTPSLGLLNATTDPLAGYIEYPSAGKGNYSQIQRWFAKNNPDPLLAKENPTITVIGTGAATQRQLQDVVDTLKDYGYQASLSDQEASRYSYPRTTLFDTTGKKPFSHNYLSSQFSVSPQTGSPFSTGSDYELIYVPGK